MHAKGSSARSFLMAVAALAVVAVTIAALSGFQHTSAQRTQIPNFQPPTAAQVAAHKGNPAGQLILSYPYKYPGPGR